MRGPGFGVLGFCGRRKIAWSLEPGAGSLELGARHMEIETSDGQTVRLQTAIGFCPQTQDSREPRADCSAFVAHLAAIRYPWTVNRA